ARARDGRSGCSAPRSQGNGWTSVAAHERKTGCSGMGNGLSAGAGAYREALDYLFVRTTGQWKFGLDRTRALLDALGNPERAFPCIHVAGTNGKGSVCATLESVLRGRGFRVAKYTSPHLIDFRERLIVDGAPVGEAAVVDFVKTWT